MRPIYLDYNATTPITDEVRAAMMPLLEHEFGNPSSSHVYGDYPRRAVQQARKEVAGLIGAHSDEIVSTSGGTESNNWVLFSLARQLGDDGRHIVISSFEHPAVEEPCRVLEKQGFTVTRLPVDAAGLIDPDDFAASLRPDTILASVMHANNEIGTIQPIAELARIAREHGVRFHTDAAQSAGKIHVDTAELGVDYLTIAGHKLYAPKGIGALYIRRDSELPPLLYGGGQEKGRRPGTENTAYIAGLGAACRSASEHLSANMTAMQQTCDRLHELLAQAVDVDLNGHPEQRLPNTLNLSFRNSEARVLLQRIADRVVASAGSACHSGSDVLSPVLQAIGAGTERGRGAVRFSTGRMTSMEEIEQAAAIISSVC
ncbi:MAG: cysteine desulfurase family protein [Spirochaeta sp.]